MIWKKLASAILNNRLPILAAVIGLSVFMGYNASKVSFAYNAGKVLPVTDSAYIRFMQFKKTFGEDGTAMVLGVKSTHIFDQSFFNDWYKLGKSFQQIKGIKAVVSIANLYRLQKDTLHHSFVLQPMVNSDANSQVAIDSIRNELYRLPFYQGLLLNSNHEATLMAVTFDNKIVNTKAREPILDTILKSGESFAKAHNETVHYSGLPLIRTVISKLVTHEFILFLSLSIAITALILVLFFRSVYAVVFPVIVVLLGVVWSLGILVLNHYSITVLTGIVPPLVVIIGIPNSIFILNKYYREYALTGDKLLSLHTVIEKTGITTFIANITTAIGFGVLYFTNSQLLTEFGLVASMSIMITFALSIILIPIIFSYLPPPGKRQSGVKDRKAMLNLLTWVDGLVKNRRALVYVFTLVLILAGVYGISKIEVNGYVIDDLPKSSNTLADLKFFEHNFEGVLPLEVSIDSKHRGGLMNLATIHKVERLENMISAYPEFSRSLSLTQVLKYSTQAFYGGDSSFYRLPNSMEQSFILSYAASSGKGTNMLRNYVDSNKQITRVSFQMIDVGSKRMNVLLNGLQPRIDSIFNPKRFHVELTGSSVIVVKGINYLVENLYQSLALAIFLIAIVMWILFRDFKMIAISLLPNLIPLLITAGLMGFAGMALKPSTILIFSIAMGISSDQTIYFLTRYRHELRNSSKSIPEIVSDTIHETGISMIYIATILFFGFGIFAASTFGGTQALGILLSFTLLVAMICNLTLLPAFLLDADKNINRKKLKQFEEVDTESQDL